MSAQFRVTGHTVVSEGSRHHSDGSRVTIYDGLTPDGAWHKPDGHAKCSCGEVSSESYKTNAARKRWHKQHKRVVLLGKAFEETS